MKSIAFLLSVAFPATLFGAEGAVCNYEVTVSHAKDLPDSDADWFWTKNYNDVYVEVIGFGLGEEGNIRSLRTRTIDESVEPEFDEKFSFSDSDAECGGKYEKFLFKLYDDDTVAGSTIFGLADPDFLGETRYLLTSEIAECDEIYTFDLGVVRNEEECGIVFVEITKGGCCSVGDGQQKDIEEEIIREEEIKEEVKEEKVKGSGGGGGKDKGRRLLA